MSLATKSMYKGDWLPLARRAWVVLSILVMALYIAGSPARLDIVRATSDWRALMTFGFTQQNYSILLAVIDFIFILAHYAIALVIFVRCKNEWMALLVALALITNGGLVPLMIVYNQFVVIQPFWRLLLNIVIYLALVSNMILLYMFPTARFEPAGTRFLAILWALLCLPAVFFPKSAISLASWPAGLQILILAFFSVSGLAAQAYRYVNVSQPVQRQQTKWAVLGLTAAALGPYAYFLPFVILPEISRNAVPNILFQRMGGSFFAFSQLMQILDSVGFNMLALIFPISFAIAILHYHLWDIDLLINRALVYGALSATLLFLYLASVLLLESLLRFISGEGNNDLVTVLSTLMIAAAFAPLRRSIQRGIDKRFYRRRFDAARTVDAFGAGLRDEVDLSTLCERLITVAEYTMQPEAVMLWLNTKDRQKSDRFA
jgi:hypothetical protein